MKRKSRRLGKGDDNTLNKVNDREVLTETVIAMNKREVVARHRLQIRRYHSAMNSAGPDLKVGDAEVCRKPKTEGQLVLSSQSSCYPFLGTLTLL